MTTTPGPAPTTPLPPEPRYLTGTLDAGTKRYLRRSARITLAAVLLAMTAAGLGGYLLHPAAAAAAPAKVITRTVTSPPKVITRWRTRTITRTVAAPAAAPSIACQEAGGSIEPGAITPGLPGDTTCSVTLLSPMGADHLAQLELTAPGGTTSTWNLANPGG